MTVSPKPWEVWRVAFDPVGAARTHEQANERPAVVVGSQYHCRLPNRLALVIPLTSKDRGLVWQPRLTCGTADRPCIALVEQIRAVSYDRLRHRERIELAGEDIETVRFLLRRMIDLEA